MSPAASGEGGDRGDEQENVAGLDDRKRDCSFLDMPEDARGMLAEWSIIWISAGNRAGRRWVAGQPLGV